MNGPSDQEPEDFRDSDLEWYAALSGQAPPDRATPAGREALALKLALLQRQREIDADPAVQAATSDEALDAIGEALLQRGRAEGLFEPAPPAADATAPPSAQVLPFPWWRRRGPALAMAASLLLGVLVLQQVLDRPDYPEPPVMLGVGDVIPAQAAQPKAAAERLATQLREAGLRPGLYQRGRRYVVDVQLMAAELAAARPAFQALGLDPAAGFNRVEISAP